MSSSGFHRGRRLPTSGSYRGWKVGRVQRLPKQRGAQMLKAADQPGRQELKVSEQRWPQGLESRKRPKASEQRGPKSPTAAGLLGPYT